MGDVVGLHQVAQHVDDLDRAVAFYRDIVGLPLERLRSHGVSVEQDAHVIFGDVDGKCGAAGENEVMGFFRDSEQNLVGYAARLPT